MTGNRDQLPPGWITGRYNGLPYEGPPLNLKNSDKDERKPTLRADAYAKVFHSDSNEDMEEYNTIIQKMALGHALLSAEERQYCRDLGRYDIFLRWIEYRYTAPEERPYDDKNSPAAGQPLF